MKFVAETTLEMALPVARAVLEKAEELFYLTVVSNSLRWSKEIVKGLAGCFTGELNESTIHISLLSHDEKLFVVGLGPGVGEFRAKLVDALIVVTDLMDESVKKKFLELAHGR